MFALLGKYYKIINREVYSTIIDTTVILDLYSNPTACTISDTTAILDLYSNPTACTISDTTAILDLYS